MDTIYGMTLTQWTSVLKENHFAVDRRHYSRAAKATVAALMTSLLARRMRREHQDAISRTEIEPPVFVLGHWRSGTTLLHEALSQDERFAYPTILDVSQPNIFLSMKARQNTAAEKKRPMDNVIINPSSPAEDEFALCKLSQRSPLLSWAFPHNELFYDRFLTFHEATREELEKFEATFIWFLRALTYKYKKPLLLKSPTHTGRIRLILDIFPDARFVHIYRNPYDVFRSTQNLFDKLVVGERLQEPADGQMKQGILRRYVDMYDALFEDIDLIPDGHYCEVRFEDLEKDMVSEVTKIYDALHLPTFERVRPKLQAYMASKANYMKNPPTPLPEDVRAQIAGRWKRSFIAWGYER